MFFNFTIHHSVLALQTLQKKLYETNNKLEEQLEKFARANAQLQARNEELDVFARIVAHDLKSPADSIIMFAKRLEQKHAAISTEKLEEDLGIITQAGYKMRNIIHELMILTGVRQKEVQIEPLDMCQILMEVQQRLFHLIGELKAEIIMPETWPAASGYPPWIEEVWANYLSNAIKYGGRPPRIEMGGITQVDGTVRFWIQDNGPGISSRDQARLFVPFERLDQIQLEGQGLGLSIVRQILEKLEGRWGVESSIGPGSLFFFTLPAA